MKKEQTDKIFDRITANGCREMNKVRFHQAINEALAEIRYISMKNKK